MTNFKKLNVKVKTKEQVVNTVYELAKRNKESFVLESLLNIDADEIVGQCGASVDFDELSGEDYGYEWERRILKCQQKAELQQLKI